MLMIFLTRSISISSLPLNQTRTFFFHFFHLHTATELCSMILVGSLNQILCLHLTEAMYLCDRIYTANENGAENGKMIKQKLKTVFNWIWNIYKAPHSSNTLSSFFFFALFSFVFLFFIFGIRHNHEHSIRNYLAKRSFTWIT